MYKLSTKISDMIVVGTLIFGIDYMLVRSVLSFHSLSISLKILIPMAK